MAGVKLGERFGSLKVKSKGKLDKHNHRYWTCTCDCGKTTEVMAHNLKSGKTTSCGCRARPGDFNYSKGTIPDPNSVSEETMQMFPKLAEQVRALQATPQPAELVSRPTTPPHELPEGYPYLDDAHHPNMQAGTRRILFDLHQRGDTKAFESMRDWLLLEKE